MSSHTDDLKVYGTDDVIQTAEQGSSAKNSSATLQTAATRAWKHHPDIRFSDFLLKPELLRCVADFGFEHPSEVQSECIPHAIFGTDLICQAKSGMGKTAVFVLATLQQIEPVDGVVSVVVLCHTRELAYQIRGEYERFSRYIVDVRTGVLFGGMPAADDTASLSNPHTCPHIVVGTPGRIRNLVQRQYLVLNDVKVFILDECDDILKDAGMRDDVQQIFFATCREKQVMMFSATLPPEVLPVCRKFMRHPVEICVDDEKLLSPALQQHFLRTEEHQKTRSVIDILDSLEFDQVCIFVNSVLRAVELNHILLDCCFPSTCIHSDLYQDERLRRYTAFKKFETRIMVATDIFGRGVDIDRVSTVINYDMTQDAESYLHRVNRAGRFGTDGTAISFISSRRDEDVLDNVQARFDVDIKPFNAH